MKPRIITRNEKVYNVLKKVLHSGKSEYSSDINRSINKILKNKDIIQKVNFGEKTYLKKKKSFDILKI